MKPTDTSEKALEQLRSSAAEYLTFIAATGAQETAVEMRYEDENIWLTQKMMATLYAVDVRTVNEHLQRVFADGELVEGEPTIRNFRIVQTEGERQVARDTKISHEQAKLHAETEFEKYRIVQDRLFESDFDRLLKEAEPLRLEAPRKPRKKKGDDA